MKRILLVEDETLLREIAEEDLTDLGFAVTSAACGDEAYSLIASGQTFDLLVTDVRMPGALDGWALARKAKDALPELMIVYVTGYSGETHEPLAGTQVLRKPYRREQLEKAVVNQL